MFTGPVMFQQRYQCQLKQLPSPLLIRLVEAVKPGELAEFTVVANMFNSEEEDAIIDKVLPGLINGYDAQKDLYLQVHLEALQKVEDWYKDGTTLVKTIRKGGKGRSPYADSTIKLRLSAEVNGTVIYSNYPEVPDQDNLKLMSKEERESFLSQSGLLTLRIDDYQLPSILIKLIKSLKKNSVVEMTTTRLDKLHKNFASPMFDQYSAFK